MKRPLLLVSFLLILLMFLSCETITDDQFSLAVGYYELGQLYEQDFEQQSKAIGQYERALEIHPGFQEAASALIILYLEAGDYELARELINKPSISANEDQFLNFQAYLALAQSDYNNAELFYMQLIEQDIAEYDVYYNLGLIYRETDREEEAIDILNKALALNPGFVPIHEQLALFSFQKEEYIDVIIRLEGLSLEDFPLSAILLAESFLYTENYAQLFPLMETQYEKHGDGASIPPDQLVRYQSLLVETALALGTIAISDERSLRYFTIVQEMGILSQAEWGEMLESLNNIEKLSATIAFISQQASTEDTGDAEDTGGAEDTGDAEDTGGAEDGEDTGDAEE